MGFSSATDARAGRSIATAVPLPEAEQACLQPGRSEGLEVAQVRSRATVLDDALVAVEQPGKSLAVGDQPPDPGEGGREPGISLGSPASAEDRVEVVPDAVNP